MKYLIILLFLFFFACQGGDKTNYNIAGPDTVDRGGSVAISVNGDARSSGRYEDNDTTQTTTRVSNRKTIITNQEAGE
jgi:hypothetical protein